MKKLVNFALFQAFWFAAVAAAGKGDPWVGAWALLPLLLAHLALTPSGERRRELAFVAGFGLLGLTLDSILRALAITTYPGTEAAWPHPTVPPFIVGLWIAFATLPRFSLGWLAGRPILAALLGAVGGPLSFLGGTRFGAVDFGPQPVVTWLVLAAEYAVVTPVLLAWAPGTRGRRAPQPLAPSRGLRSEA